MNSVFFVAIHYTCVWLLEMNRKPFHLQTLQTFPSDPAELPTDNYAFAYDDSDPPVCMEYPALGRDRKIRAIAEHTQKLASLRWIVSCSIREIFGIEGATSYTPCLRATPCTTWSVGDRR